MNKKNQTDDNKARKGSGIKKDTNPKDSIGIRKVPFSVLPFPVIAEAALGLLEGALKYGRHNYRAIGVRASVYVDAAMRHLTAYWEGEDIDPDSELPHISKAISCLIVLRDAQIQDKCNDDRPPKTPTGWIPNLNKKAAALLDKYSNPPEAYTNNNIDRECNEKANGCCFTLEVQGDGDTSIEDMWININHNNIISFTNGSNYEFTSDLYKAAFKLDLNMDYVPVDGEIIRFKVEVL